MFQSRRVRLKPNKAQAEFFRKNFGATRFIYNWGLERLNKRWEENKDKEKKIELNILLCMSFVRS